MANLPMGGGKGVILSGESRAKTTELLSAFARSVESLCGRYLPAQDVGISEADIIAISQDTKYVSGLPAGQGPGGRRPGGAVAALAIAQILLQNNASHVKEQVKQRRSMIPSKPIGARSSS